VGRGRDRRGQDDRRGQGGAPLGWICAAITGVGARYGTAWLGGLLSVWSARSLGRFSRTSPPARSAGAGRLIPAAMLLVPGSMGFRGMASLLARDTLSGRDRVRDVRRRDRDRRRPLIANATVSPPGL
jgi:hypothetical protein